MEGIVLGRCWKILNPTVCTPLSIIHYWWLPVKKRSKTKQHPELNTVEFLRVFGVAATQRYYDEQFIWKCSKAPLFHVLYYINNTSVPWVAEAWQRSGPRLFTPSGFSFGLKGSAGVEKRQQELWLSPCAAQNWEGYLLFNQLYFQQWRHANTSRMVYSTHKTLLWPLNYFSSLSCD